MYLFQLERIWRKKKYFYKKNLIFKKFNWHSVLFVKINPFIVDYFNMSAVLYDGKIQRFVFVSE